MKAVDYLKERERMTKGRCPISEKCCKCPFNHNNNGKQISCTQIEEKYPEQAVEIVEKWAKENPVKTYKNILLEKFPNTQLESDGTPDFCPNDIYGVKIKPLECHDIECIDCWNREYKEE